MRDHLEDTKMRKSERVGLNMALNSLRGGKPQAAHMFNTSVKPTTSNKEANNKRIMIWDSGSWSSDPGMDKGHNSAQNGHPCPYHEDDATETKEQLAIK